MAYFQFQDDELTIEEIESIRSRRLCPVSMGAFNDAINLNSKKEVTVNDDSVQSGQKIMVFQQNGSGERKISGLREYGGDLFKLEIVNIDEVLPIVLDDTSAYLPKDLSCDLVLDFLRHNDLSTDLAALCEKKEIPLVASGKKIIGKGILTPPT